MELPDYGNAASTSGLTAKAFGFEMNAKMYDIVVNRMYSNKPGAVIRELSCNAWDAHVEAGTTDTPFELWMPSWLDKTFRIRDYGTGIPHDKFEDIYTNVGKSTKEDSNELIGAYGLGSKTPFTMTDMFTVVNRYAGVKTTWLCFKDSGTPQVSQVASEPCDEHSGLEVSFAFSDSYVSDFKEQLIRQLQYFPVKPKIHADFDPSWPELPVGWEDLEYFYSKTEGHSWRSHKHYVIMGNVAYSLEEYEFSEYSAVFSEPLTIKLPIGAADVPPSREHMEMTEKTKASIKKVLSKIKTEYTEEFRKRIAKCASYIDMVKVCYQSNRRLLSKVDTVENKGVVYPYNTVALYSLSLKKASVYRINSHYKNPYVKCTVPIEAVVKGLEFYVNDLGPGSRVHIRNCYGKITPVKEGASVFIVEPVTGTVKTHTDRVNQGITEAKELFNVEVKLLSGLIGFPPTKDKTTGARSKLKPNQVFTVVRGNGHTVKSWLQPYTKDELPEDGYVIYLSGWSLEGCAKHQMDVLLAVSDNVDKPLYVVRKTSKKMVPENFGNYAQAKEIAQSNIRGFMEEKDRLWKLNEVLGYSIRSVLLSMDQKKLRKADKKLAVLGRYVGYINKKYNSMYSVSTSVFLSLNIGKIKTPPVKIPVGYGPLVSHYNTKYSEIFTELNSNFRRATYLNTFLDFLIKHNGEQ